MLDTQQHTASSLVSSHTNCNPRPVATLTAATKSADRQPFGTHLLLPTAPLLSAWQALLLGVQIFSDKHCVPRQVMREHTRHGTRLKCMPNSSVQGTHQDDTLIKTWYTYLVPNLYACRVDGTPNHRTQAKLTDP